MFTRNMIRVRIHDLKTARLILVHAAFVRVCVLTAVVFHGIGFKVGRASKWTRNLVARCGSIHGNNERTNIIPSCLVVL